MEAALTAFLEHGVLGAVAAVSIGYSWRLYTRLVQVQERRVHDAQAVTQTMLELNDRWSAVVADHTKAVQTLQITVDVLRESLTTTRARK